MGQESEQDGQGARPGPEDTLVRLQEVLILVRGLLAEAHTHMATIDDLKSSPASIRICLALTSEHPFPLVYTGCNCPHSCRGSGCVF